MSESLLVGLLPGFFLKFLGSASIYTYIAGTYSFAQFIAAPLIGIYSDQYGRKPVMSVCISGSVVGISIVAFTLLFDWSNLKYFLPALPLLPIYLLFIARLIDGISGGTVALSLIHI